MSDWAPIAEKDNTRYSRATDFTSAAAVCSVSQVRRFIHADICGYLETRVQRKYWNTRGVVHLWHKGACVRAHTKCTLCTKMQWWKCRAEWSNPLVTNFSDLMQLLWQYGTTLTHVTHSWTLHLEEWTMDTRGQYHIVMVNWSNVYVVYVLLPDCLFFAFFFFLLFSHLEL